MIADSVAENPAQTPPERLAYTPAEVAALTPLSLKGVYAALESGELVGRRITARRWSISRENLMRYLNDPGREARR